MTVLHRTDRPHRYAAHVAGNRYIVARTPRGQWRISLPGDPRFRPTFRSTLRECREWFDRVAAVDKRSRPADDPVAAVPDDPFDGLV